MDTKDTPQKLWVHGCTGAPRTGARTLYVPVLQKWTLDVPNCREKSSTHRDGSRGGTYCSTYSMSAHDQRKCLVNVPVVVEWWGLLIRAFELITQNCAKKQTCCNNSENTKRTFILCTGSIPSRAIHFLSPIHIERFPFSF
jgi:hypothetical protein